MFEEAPLDPYQEAPLDPDQEAALDLYRADSFDLFGVNKRNEIAVRYCEEHKFLSYSSLY